MFFDAIDGTRYPTALITAIGEAREVEVNGLTREINAVSLSTGMDVDVYGFVVGNIVRGPVAAFAAAAGTYIVSYDDGDINKWPVVAWSISKDGGVYPVTMNGVNGEVEQMHDVLLPTGEVTAYDEAWDSLASWEAEKCMKQTRRK